MLLTEYSADQPNIRIRYRLTPAALQPAGDRGGGQQALVVQAHVLAGLHHQVEGEEGGLHRDVGEDEDGSGADASWWPEGPPTSLPTSLLTTYSAILESENKDI